MFIHSWDEAGEDEWRPFLAAHGFGELVAAGRSRDLAVVVPTQFVLVGDVVLVHLLRSNPIWPAIEENPAVLLAVSGDWAFIPSSWKATGDEDPRAGIPTTYYASVQLTGRAEVVRDAPGVADVLRQQLARLQPGVDIRDPAEHGRTLEAIWAARISVESVRAKFKYGGNVDEAHRRAVAEQLEARGGPGDHPAAAHVRQHLDLPPG